MRHWTPSSLVVAASLLAGCLADTYTDPYASPYEGEPESEESIFEGTRPELGPTTRQADPPPPLSGGTLAVTANGIAVAADPDRDAVYLVDLATAAVRTVTLLPHDEPGRVAIDGGGRAHVALRRGGGVVAIDLATATVASRREPCAAPRGIVWEPRTDLVHVACAGGELVSLPAAGGEATRRLELLPDLRDVIVGADGALLVSTFRSAELVRVAMDGAVEVGPATQRRVAWRMIPSLWSPTSNTIGEDAIVLAQSVAETVTARPEEADSFADEDVDVEEDVEPTPPPQPPRDFVGHYWISEKCGSSAIRTLLAQRGKTAEIPHGVLPVDVAARTDLFAIAAAGYSRTKDAKQVLLLPSGVLGGCRHAMRVSVPGQVTSVAFAPDGRLLALSREPAALHVLEIGAGTPATPEEWEEPSPANPKLLDSIALSIVRRDDTGHAVFHASLGRGLACASCHAEGREDGNVWIGQHRTPSLVGRLDGTAPYGSRGVHRDLAAIVASEVSRSGGLDLKPDQTAAAADWLLGLSPLPARKAGDAVTAERGKALFEARCASCHAGPLGTNNASLDLGTGRSVQVPPLVNVRYGAPYLHDGRATTLPGLLADRHAGVLLNPTEIADLASHLESF